MLLNIWTFVFILALVEGNIVLNEGFIKTYGDLYHEINYPKLLDFNQKYGNENVPRKVFERPFDEGALKPSNFNKYNLAKRKKRSSNDENYTFDEKINFSKFKSNNDMDNDLTENKVKNVNIRETADNGVKKNDVQYNSNILNQKHHHFNHFKPGKKSPYTYLHIRPAEYENSKTEVYFLGPDEINENTIRKIIGARKISEIPHCSKLEYETVEKRNYLANLNRAEKRKVPRDLYKKPTQDPAPTISESVNNIGSKGKLDFQQDYQKDKQTYIIKQKQPLNYINVKNYEEKVHGRNSKYWNPLKRAVGETNNNIKNVFKVSDEPLNEGNNRYLMYPDSQLVGTQASETPVANLTGEFRGPEKSIYETSNNLSLKQASENNGVLISGAEIKNQDKSRTFQTNVIQHREGINHNNESKFVLSSINQNYPNKLNSTYTIEDRSSLSGSVQVNTNLSDTTKNEVKESDSLLKTMNNIPEQSIQTNINKAKQLVTNEAGQNMRQWSNVHKGGSSLINISHKNVNSNSKGNDISGNNQENVSYYLHPISHMNSNIVQNADNNNETGNNLLHNPQEMPADTIRTSADQETLQNKVQQAEFLSTSLESKNHPDTLSSEVSPNKNDSKLGNNISSMLLNGSILSSNTVQLNQGVESQKKTENWDIKNTEKIKSQWLGNENNYLITNNPAAIKDEEHAKSSMANISNNANKQVSRTVEKKFQRSVETPIMNSRKEINIPKFIQGAKLITNEDEIKKAISQIQDSRQPNDSDLNSPVKNGMTKVIVIQTKQKELCPPELDCMQTPKFVHCADSNCHKTTPCLDHFKEIHEGYREDNLVEFNDFYKENPKLTKKCSLLPDSPPHNFQNMTSAGNTGCPSQCMQKVVKREVKNNELYIKPVVIIKKSVENIEEKGSHVLPFTGDVANFKDESELTFEKGNKKVENKILEGFINSIIANYSKEGGRGTTQEPVENYDKPDDSNAVLRLIKDLTNKRNTEGSENWNLMSIIIPESSIAKYKDCSDYSKLGPFNDVEIKSFLQKNTMN